MNFVRGQRVRVKNTAIPFSGCEGIVSSTDHYGNSIVQFEFTEIRDGCYAPDELERVEETKI